jgi:toxin ParE1/3/4
MIDYRFLLPAEEEMTEASQFYEAASAGLGTDFLDDVQRVLNAVRESPLLGPEIGGKFRRALLHRFPFSVIYSVEVGGILVIALAHQRRRPGYWRNRPDR